MKGVPCPSLQTTPRAPDSPGLWEGTLRIISPRFQGQQGPQLMCELHVYKQHRQEC